MTIISFKERAERIKARSDEYRSGQMTEAVFRASLHALGVRRDDVGYAQRENAPAAPADAEQVRYERSVEWLRDFLARRR